MRWRFWWKFSAAVRAWSGHYGQSAVHNTCLQPSAATSPDCLHCTTDQPVGINPPRITALTLATVRARVVAINRYLPPALRLWKSSCMSLLLTINWMGQTGRQKPDRYIDVSMWPASTNYYISIGLVKQSDRIAFIVSWWYAC